MTTFTRYTQSSSGSISFDVMFPGIAAQCLSYAMSFVLLSLCCAFPPQACFRVQMCILIVVRVRNSQHAPQQTEFPNTTAFDYDIVLETLSSWPVKGRNAFGDVSPLQFFSCFPRLADALFTVPSSNGLVEAQLFSLGEASPSGIEHG